MGKLLNWMKLSRISVAVKSLNRLSTKSKIIVSEEWFLLIGPVLFVRSIISCSPSTDWPAARFHFTEIVQTYHFQAVQMKSVANETLLQIHRLVPFVGRRWKRMVLAEIAFDSASVIRPLMMTTTTMKMMRRRTRTIAVLAVDKMLSGLHRRPTHDHHSDEHYANIHRTEKSLLKWTKSPLAWLWFQLNKSLRMIKHKWKCFMCRRSYLKHSMISTLIVAHSRLTSTQHSPHL